VGGTFDPGDKILRIFGRFAKPESCLKAIGLLMVEESQEAFSQQRFGKRKWRERSVPNVFGIIADFSQVGTTKPPKRRFDKTPALEDKGDLLKSLSFWVTADDTVEVGSRLKYAGKHHRGEKTESEVITALVQKKLWTWLKGEPKQLRRKLGWLLNAKFTGKRLTMQLPERPITGITQYTRDGIKYTIGVDIFEVGP